jgi:hypothetical protein
MRTHLLLTAVFGLILAAAPAARADAEADARAIIDKAIKAHGGADNLNKYKAMVAKMKGKVEVNGMTIDYSSTASVQSPDKMRVDTEVEVMGQKFTFVQILNGDKGWIKVLDKVMEMDKDQVAEAREHLYASWVGTLAPLTDKAFKLSPMGESKVDGKDAVGVQVSYKDRRDVNLFFDKKTGMLVKTETRSKDLLGGNNQEFTAETFHSSYKEFNGIQRPVKLILKRDGKDFGEAEITEYEGKEKLDDSVFAKPE